MLPRFSVFLLSLLLCTAPIYAGLGKADNVDTPQNGLSFVVNSEDDTNDLVCGTNNCTLREAIETSNLQPDDNIITFNIPNTGPHTITLNTALPNLNDNITIDNDDTGAELVTVTRNTTKGTPAFTIFRISRGVTAGISGLTLSNGSGLSGGGIENRGTLNLSNCTLRNNFSAVMGGGIFSIGTLNLSNSTLANNSAVGAGGGGICNLGTSKVSNSTFIRNFANSGGGGIENFGPLTLINSTLSQNNSARIGGGIYNAGPLTVQNSTLSQNFAGTNGGGICNYSTAMIESSTLSNNSAAASGDGIYNNTNCTVVLGNSILHKGSVSGETLFNNSGTVNSQGYNLSSDDGGGFLTGTDDHSNTDPKLGALADNGGFTQTHTLLIGSPAINKGNSPLATDQRGIARPQGSASDIGAFEVVLLGINDQAISESESSTSELPPL